MEVNKWTPVCYLSRTYSGVFSVEDTLKGWCVNFLYVISGGLAYRMSCNLIFVEDGLWRLLTEISGGSFRNNLQEEDLRIDPRRRWKGVGSGD